MNTLIKVLLIFLFLSQISLIFAAEDKTTFEFFKTVVTTNSGRKYINRYLQAFGVPWPAIKMDKQDRVVEILGKVHKIEDFIQEWAKFDLEEAREASDLIQKPLQKLAKQIDEDGFYEDDKGRPLVGKKAVNALFRDELEKISGVVGGDNKRPSSLVVPEDKVPLLLSGPGYNELHKREDGALSLTLADVNSINRLEFKATLENLEKQVQELLKRESEIISILKNEQTNWTETLQYLSATEKAVSNLIEVAYRLDHAIELYRKNWSMFHVLSDELGGLKERLLNLSRDMFKSVRRISDRRLTKLDFSRQANSRRLFFNDLHHIHSILDTMCALGVYLGRYDGDGTVALFRNFIDEARLSWRAQEVLDVSGHISDVILVQEWQQIEEKYKAYIKQHHPDKLSRLQDETDFDFSRRQRLAGLFSEVHDLYNRLLERQKSCSRMLKMDKPPEQSGGGFITMVLW